MYSNIKSVAIVISLLKKFDISHIVLSPGGSDIPIIHSLQQDPYFQCYSVVDERSAAYYAMGLSQELDKPVACVCTSGTAVCNYLPGITEAYYQNVPVVAITADKNPYYQGQLETQKIEQTHIFDGVIKKSVNLPVVNTEVDEWLCNRLVNEALLELSHHGKGPVHINIPIVGNQNAYTCKELPDERKISIVSYNTDNNIWEEKKKELSFYKKILIVVGQDLNFSEEDIKVMNGFFECYDCIFAVENLSNLNCKGCINTYPISEILSGQVLADLKPDLIISIGNNLSAYLLKETLREHFKSLKNWLISESGEIRDTFMCLDTIFECTPIYFFEKMIENVKCTNITRGYFDSWSEISKKIRVPEFPFSNMYIAQRLAEIIPENSIIHTAILNSTRVMQYCRLPKGVKSYSNVGALGIDGCFSTFAGQAAATKGLAFLLIGDLSFFYDMNAATIRSISNNVRIILLNNRGGAEFHVYDHNVEQLDKYVCAEHKNCATGYIESLGFDYYSAYNKEEFDKAIKAFGKKSEKPLFIECFTDMHDDAKLLRKFYQETRDKFTSNGDKMIMKAKKIGRAVLSENQITVAKNLFGKIKK